MSNKKYIPNLSEHITRLKEKYSFHQILSSKGYAYIKNKSTNKYTYYKLGDDNLYIFKTSTDEENYKDYNGQYGDIIDFLVNKNYAQNSVDAVHQLNALDASVIENIAPPTLKSPVRDVANYNKKRSPLYPVDSSNYLVKHRHIPLNVLQNDLFINRVFGGFKKYTDNTKNCIFPLLSKGKEVGQNIRNLNVEHLVADSDKLNGYWSSAKKNNSYLVTENPIDAISHFCLYQKEYRYLSTVGNPSNNIIKLFASIPIQNRDAKLFLGGDNDIGGQLFNLSFLKAYFSQHKAVPFVFDYKLLQENNTLLIDITNKEGKEPIEGNITIANCNSNVTQVSKAFNRLNNMIYNSSLELVIPISKDFNKDLENSILKKKDLDKSKPPSFIRSMAHDSL